MKRLFLISLLAISFLSFAQTKESFAPNGNKVVAYDIAISLAKATTNYSSAFDLLGFLPHDSIKVMPFLWMANDTCQLTITLQTRNSFVAGRSVVAGDWTDAATITTSQANAGNDTLYVKELIQRGTAMSGSNQVSMAGKIGNEGRIKVVFGAPTTVGNGTTAVGDAAYFRSWLYLTKQ